MIQFRSIFYQNFMSVGNGGVFIDFTVANSTLLSGANGFGKSSVIDALCYGLFGIAFRSINKSQLINSINGKNCKVELNFENGSNSYKVIRGMKPDIFEIYQNNELISKEASVKDYQSVLENQILKFNYKTFPQVIALGSVSYTPFMKLKAADRRVVIEEILDIDIFSSMVSLHKNYVNDIKNNITENSVKARLITQDIATQDKILQLQTESKNSKLQMIEDSIKEKEKNEVELINNIDKINTSLKSLSQQLKDKDVINARYQKLINSIHTKTYQKSELLKKKDFYQNNSVCPTCSVEITRDHLQKHLDEINTTLEQLETNINNLLQAKTVADELIGNLNKLSTEETNSKILLSSNTNSLSLVKQEIRDLKYKLNNINDDTYNIEIEEQKKRQLISEQLSIQNESIQLTDTKTVYDIVSSLLKDSGIKSAIIKEYLPILNKVINNYLEKLDFYVQFELDENFNEVIKSRYRDEFSYASFSEGEKQKLDIAILLTWRYIARLKNSVNCNLLFLDEVLNSNLDSNSVELLMDIIDELKQDCNIFVITHKNNEIMNRFDRVIEFRKVGNFSQIVDSN